MTSNPKEILQTFCQALADGLSPLGYTYSASQRTLKAQNPDLTFQISFWTSQNNRAGTAVEFNLVAQVRSRTLDTWRKSQAHPMGSPGWFAGGLWTNLKENLAHKSWNLVGPGAYDQALIEAGSVIQTHILPYFEAFKNPEQIIQTLLVRDLPGLDPGNALEYVLATGTTDQAQDVLNHLFIRWSQLRPEIQLKTQEVKTQGFPNYFPTDFGSQIAWVAAAQGLRVL